MDNLENSGLEKTNKPEKAFSTEQIFGKPVLDHGFTAIPNILLRGQKRLGLNPVHFSILVQLLSYWFDPKRPPYPSKQDLMDRLGISKTTLQKHIRELEQQGFLRREQQTTAFGDFGSNIYHLEGLVEKLKKLVPDFDAERKERAESRSKTEKPNARRIARENK